ncbi:NADPH:quinone reductase-like Zn-dependent oxidoreductase [Chitinophaga niastensis]|uniref:NADPH:quinone reductase-like Zn-dependent oxidoreductase n=1 Tax=Chitinophaga niastensis TaxID=536980 RepID=A0A2P8H9N2_CHINA|nr:NAD(P)-dependent alcohol dehydrogenase [Chitinophaga niastensis]PSL42879.1 NADPH:quinone reductase-like Zn-dependent oxidoreductase [Chitinophaga niastensis]
MKSYHVNLGAGLSGLTLKEHNEPTPGLNEVVIKIKASSLNYREIMILRGFYPLPVRPDVVPLCDGAGEVVAIGAAVTRVKVGDRVAGQVFPEWQDGPFAWENAAQLGGSLNGMLTELAVLHENAVVHIPAHLSYVAAASLPCAGLTAWNALTGGRGLVAGQTVLTLGSGGVSLFAVQLAKLAGARVIATTSSEEKGARLKALGADEIINYAENTDWHLQVRELTNGKGVDHVVEVGGAGTMEKSIRSTAIEGEVAMIGGVANDSSLLNVNLITYGMTNMRPIAIGSKAQFVAMNKAIAVNGMQPVIDQVFHFSEAAEAFRYYMEGKYFGKVVISHE